MHVIFFLRTLFECMFIVTWLMCQKLRRETKTFAAEAPTLLFVKASGIFINFLLFCLCMINVFSLSMCRCYWYHYGETIQSSTPLLAGLESYFNLVDMLSYAEIIFFSKTRFQMYPRLQTTWSNLMKKTTWSNWIVNGWRISPGKCGNCRRQMNLTC